ncbi:hypothetical protein PPL_12071 [Heterostelium album PN500]|uniref:Uncharacterized protein n=1 Tax=Heterostelium pallidum (strain ATCC 26659 / Pp 5 / PN500) TaxID=670386 RepID=D3BLL8_HETP5|nr:hypothetical protein PPL_12071 [Heterostelium album PN500]EFA77469.1 hypothetical protein PPL_12071 [Heterostelium album PN500]|eukprot:XP_020429597.1 hypothetical protein PPL_12071 [Heterostelium album PN500]
MCECETPGGRITFNGEIQLIKRQIDSIWKINTLEGLSPKGETRVVIKNPKAHKILVHLTLQGNCQNQVVMKSYFNDVQSFTNTSFHNHEFVPFSLTLNEVTDETNIVIDFKATNGWNNGSFANGILTGFIREL